MTYFDDHEDRAIYGRRLDDSDECYEADKEPHCRACGSTDVRWRQQTGKWVLFSLQPGVEHQCNAEDLVKDFD